MLYGSYKNFLDIQAKVEIGSSWQTQGSQGLTDLGTDLEKFFNIHLKIERQWSNLTSLGTKFQIYGATTNKALPLVVSCQSWSILCMFV